jgi:inorganic pyrophosphatase
MSDEKGPDAKVLCVPAHDQRWTRFQDLDDLEEHLLDEIGHFFEVYKELEPGKGTNTRSWESRVVAEAEVEASRQRLRDQPVA